jgi:hypothetical protein
MGKNSGVSGERRADELPIGKPFEPGQSGNPNGCPKGSLSLDTMVRRILEEEEELPEAIAETIHNAVGADKNALEATIIVGLLQALQGDKDCTKLRWERGYGKVADKTVVEGAPDKPIQHTFTSR